MNKKTQTLVIVALQIEGLHCWLGAPNYLKNEHRHIFHITCKRLVTHDDRDIEFIELKNQIIHYLLETYAGTGTTCNFKTMSCEMIARELLEKFDLEYCSVMEDNENGAEIKALPC